MLTSAFLQKGSWLEKESQKERKVLLLAPLIDIISECQVHIQMVQATVKRQDKKGINFLREAGNKKTLTYHLLAAHWSSL